jgi:hypothetical protein
MFTIDGALNAYRASLYAGARYDTEARVGERSLPIIGGVWSRIQQGCNSLWRIPATVGGFVLGHSEVTPPAMPEVPEAFRGTDLETAFTDAWRLKGQTIEARVSAVRSLMHLDIQGWQQHNSVAEYARTKETNVTFPEERTVRENPSGAEFFAGNLGSLTANVPLLGGVGRMLGGGVLNANI